MTDTGSDSALCAVSDASTPLSSTLPSGSTAVSSPAPGTRLLISVSSTLINTLYIGQRSVQDDKTQGTTTPTPLCDGEGPPQHHPPIGLVRVSASSTSWTSSKLVSSCSHDESPASDTAVGVFGERQDYAARVDFEGAWLSKRRTLTFRKLAAWDGENSFPLSDLV